MPSTAFQLTANKRFTSLVLAACSQSIANASNAAVKRERDSAHGTDT